MLQRVMIDGIKLPRLYIAENKSDAELAMSKGIPFVRWTQGQDKLIKILLRPVLERMFPDIMWSKVLGRKRSFRTEVTITESLKPEPHDQTDMGIRLDRDGEIIEKDEGKEVEGWSMIDVYEDEDEDTLMESSIASSDERLFHGGGGDMVVTHNLDIEDYVGDLSSCVDLNVLQRLRLMPAFLGNILDCIKLNAGSGLYWREGYNKRLGIPVGRFDAAGQLPNLIILDVSGSIPRGISATMISLVDTLRTQLTADLIITARRSRFYAMGDELPDPDEIRRIFPLGNESAEFIGILNDRIQGRHYGHVFSFGDNDTPSYHEVSLPGTRVEHVHHYHTWSKTAQTGYAKWCHMLAAQPEADFDCSWCEVIRQ